MKTDLRESPNIEDNLPVNIVPPDQSQKPMQNSSHEVIMGTQSADSSVQNLSEGKSDFSKSINTKLHVPENLIQQTTNNSKLKLYLIVGGSSIVLIILVLIFLLTINKSHKLFFYSPNSSGNTYTDSLSGFKINPPKGWKINSSTTNTSWDAPNNGKEGTGYFEAGIDVTVTSSSSNNIDDALTTYTKQEHSNSYYNSYEVISKTKTKVNGVEAYILKSTNLESTGSDVSYTITSTEIFELKNGVIYDASSNIADGFKKNYTATINKSLLTFKPGSISNDSLSAHLTNQANADNVASAEQLPVDNSTDFSNLISTAKSIYFSQGPVIGITPSLNDENNACENFSAATSANRYNCSVEFYKTIYVSNNFSSELQAMTKIENQAKNSGFSNPKIDVSSNGTPASNYSQYYSASSLSSNTYCYLKIDYNPDYSPPQISYDLSCQQQKSDGTKIYTSIIPNGFHEVKTQSGQ